MREKRGNNAQYQKDINGWPACSDGSRLRRHRDKSALRDEIDCAITTYLIVVSRVNVQKINETDPITKSGLIPVNPPLSSTIDFIT